MANDEPRPFPVPEPRQQPDTSPPVARPPAGGQWPAGPEPAGGATGGGTSPPQAGRPRHFPGPFPWLLTGIARNPRSVLAALVGTWFYVPFALVTAVISAVVLGLIGFVSGLTTGWDELPPVLVDLPLLGAALEALLPRSGGVIAGVVGVLLGLLLGFLGGLLVFWTLVFDDPVAGAGRLLGVIGFGLLVGLLYTLYRLVFESAVLRAAGTRRMSRRERELLLPVVQECATRLRLPNHPPIRVDDRHHPYAAAHARHLVVSRGLLEEVRFDRAVIAGVLAHELVHWRNGDAIAASFVRGVALPLYLVYSAAGWLTARARHPLVSVLVWLVAWPVLVTVRGLIIPVQAADARGEELRADQGAVLAGHRDGLRRAVARFEGSFEPGADGWTRAVSARHPAGELRLERLEDPDRRYPLPEQEPPAGATGAGGVPTPR